MTNPLHPGAEWIGWLATAVFVSSYFFGRAQAVRRVQMLGASLWMTYGLATGATPVVVANVLVLAAAAFAPSRAGVPPVPRPGGCPPGTGAV